MRKWTYLVAALTLMGATTVLTGCLDNEEPASITELRGAKAELIKAKAAVQIAEAAYRTAEIGIVNAKAAYLAEKAAQEKIRTEIYAAQSEKEKAYWEQEAAKGLEIFNAKMYALQQETAENKATYEKALIDIEVALIGYKESVYSKALYELLYSEVFSYKNFYFDPNTGQPVFYDVSVYGLSGLGAKLASEQSTLADLMRKKAELEFTNNPDALITGVTNQIAYQQGVVTGEEKNLADLKLVVGTPLADWETKYESIKTSKKDIETKQKALDIAEAEELVPFEQELQKLRNIAAAQSEFTFDVPAVIQNDFYDIVSNLKTSPVDNYATILKFALMDNLGDYSFPKGFSLSLNMAAKQTMLNSFDGAIENYLLNDNDLADATNQLARDKQVYDDYKAQYDNDLKAWQDALTAYSEVYNAGKYSDADHNARKVIIDAYSKYTNDYAAETDATQQDVIQKAFTAKLKVYLTNRAVVDGFKIMKTADPTKVIDPTVAADFTQWEAINILTDKFGLDIQAGSINYGGYYKAYEEAIQAIGYKMSGLDPNANRQTEVTYKEWLDNSSLVASNQLADKTFKARDAYEMLNTKLTNKTVWDALYATVSTLKEGIDKAINENSIAMAAAQKLSDEVTEKYAAKNAEYDVQLAGLQNILEIMWKAIDPNATFEGAYDAAMAQLKRNIAAIEGATGSNGIYQPGSLLLAQTELKTLQNFLAALKSGDYKPALDAQIKQKEAEIAAQNTVIEVLNVIFKEATAKKDQLISELTK